MLDEIGQRWQLDGIGSKHLEDLAGSRVRRHTGFRPTSGGRIRQSQGLVKQGLDAVPNGCVRHFGPIWVS